jgi:hypothetical protein
MLRLGRMDVRVNGGPRDALRRGVPVPRMTSKWLYTSDIYSSRDSMP